MAAAAVIIPAAMAIMILLLNPTTSDALTSFKPLNNDTSAAGKYLIGDQDLDSEFLMESHISRILAGSQNFQTSKTNDANKASGGGCGRPPRYDSCLGQKSNNPPPENCGTFNRNNPC
ncbi:uncharacterized protein LOC111452044 [Cucurbita moschata]|uniref:Uncharacterized protein LOC111452044 n=1 Tax=Cucurbita moschata TaxID=3662 RepID=A0A6J1G927_CUCMO|nr:uncharacterized protein LOC111452044 [Cucurbita moschata]